jgi:solute carrier family 10 (sodium/bile acid cotransporter), member 7
MCMVIRMKPGLDGFLLAMIAAVALAWIFPDPGAQGGFLHPELLNKLGVALIFFLHGLTLSFAALKTGTLRWPLHLVVQVATFVVFPLLGLLLLSVFGGWFDPDLRTGIFFLCALPSTVSSSVALTAAARGNVPAAVFNATLSSLLGVVITPFWLGLALGSSGQTFPVGKVILDLCEWLLLPLALGQLARPWLGAIATRHKSRISKVDRATILMLVYTSFCDSVKGGIWTHHGVAPLLLTLALSLVLFFSVMSLCELAARALDLPVPERITVVFCGSKKTLASGVPMARLIFGSHPGLGMILLPIMIYHPLQLVICGFLAGRWAKRPDDGAQLVNVQTSAPSANAP